MAFRGINCKTSVKVDDTLALSQLTEEFLKLIIYSRPNLASLLTLELTGVWLRVRPVCSGEVWWGPRSNSTVVRETNVYFMKVPSLVWHPGDKFFFDCFWRWLFQSLSLSLISIVHFVLLVTLNLKRNFMKIWKKKIMNYQKEIKEHFQIRFSITYPKMWE